LRSGTINNNPLSFGRIHTRVLARIFFFVPLLKMYFTGNENKDRTYENIDFSSSDQIEKDIAAKMRYLFSFI
jgi:hypothetical protein